MLKKIVLRNRENIKVSDIDLSESVIFITSKNSKNPIGFVAKKMESDIDEFSCHVLNTLCYNVKAKTLEGVLQKLDKEWSGNYEYYVEDGDFSTARRES